MDQHDRNDELHRPVDLPSYVKRPKWKGYKGSMDDYIDALELYIDNLEALLAAKSEWRPIKSVPKDGTVVDLWHREGGRFIDQWWVDKDDCFTCLFGVEPFTHWMLVEPPEG